MRLRGVVANLLPLAGAAVLCGCSHAALDPAGPQARHIAGLWWLFFWVCVAVYALVMLFLLVGVARRKAKGVDPASEAPVVSPEPAAERRRAVAVGSFVAVTVGILFVLLAGDFVTGRAIHSMNGQNPLTIRITGRQWWWEAQYQSDTPSDFFTTANEIHIPVGQPVKIELQSSDVIHSFWAPNLHGKKDMVPGHPTVIWIQTDRAGTYHGQCAEFCGYQHAKMRFMVIAEPAEQFNAWLTAQRQPAPAPQTESQKHGQKVFLSSTCVMCHTVGGTPAFGRVGPPLTHLASRQTIASGTLLNTRGNLAGWILDPQHIKPGVRMPQHTNFQPQDLQALLDYLETLK